jgi:hypothetical protein
MRPRPHPDPLTINRALMILRARKPSLRFAWHAHRLTRDRTRRRLATGLERAVAAAQLPPESLTAAVPLQRRAVIDCRDELLALAERLRGPEPVYAQGVALVSELLRNADSPLYQSREELPAAIETAAAALEGDL